MKLKHRLRVESVCPRLPTVQVPAPWSRRRLGASESMRICGYEQRQYRVQVQLKALNAESARRVDDGWSVVCAEVTLPRMYSLKRICNISKLNA